MNQDTVNAIGKWLGGAIVLGGVFALVWVGKADPQVFLGLAGTIIGGGVYHVAANAGGSSAQGVKP